MSEATPLHEAFATFIADNTQHVDARRHTRFHAFHRLFVAYVCQYWPGLDSVSGDELTALLAEHEYGLEIVTDRWGEEATVIPGLLVKRRAFVVPGEGQ